MTNDRLLLPRHLIAEAFGVTPDTVSRWPVKPVERRGRESLYDLREVIAYRTQPERIEKLNLEAERARLAKEQADKTAMENAERRQHLVDVNLVADWWVKIITTAKQRFLGLPTKIAPLVIGCKTIPQAKEVIENNIHEILHELSATDPIAGASGVECLAPAAETDGERMGGPEPKTKPRKQRRARSVAH